MALHAHIDDDDDNFGDGGDCTRTDSNSNSGNKRGFGDLEKMNSKEIRPGAETGTILHLRESLTSCEHTLATCLTELETAKSDIHKWISSFENKNFIPAGSSPEPRYVINFLQSLKSSEESLRFQLDKAKKKEVALIVMLAKREKEIAELKAAVRGLKAQLKPPSIQARRLLLDPAIHEEFTRLKSLVEEKDKKVKELQDHIAVMSSSSSNKIGKMLMDKCRVLQEENKELGNRASEGKIHELGMKLALQKSQNSQLRTQYEALHKHMEGLVNDVERANELLIVLQEKLALKDREQTLQQPKNPLVEEKVDSPPTEKQQPKHEVVISEKADIN